MPHHRHHKGEQKAKDGKTRNDRIVAVEQGNHSFADIGHIDDLGKQFLKELEEFFVNYHRLTGEEYRILGSKGPARAWKLLRQDTNKG